MHNFGDRKPWINLLDRSKWVDDHTEWFREYTTDWSIGSDYYDAVINLGMLYGDDDRKIVTGFISVSPLESHGLGMASPVANVNLYEECILSGIPAGIVLGNNVAMRNMNVFFEAVMVNTAGLPNDLVAYLVEHRVLYNAFENSNHFGCCSFYKIISSKRVWCLNTSSAGRRTLLLSRII